MIKLNEKKKNDFQFKQIYDFFFVRHWEIENYQQC